MSAKALLLFDIDGTLLVRGADAHKDAVHAALRRVYGIAEPGRPRIEAAGKTDIEIAREILVASGVARACPGNRSLCTAASASWSTRRVRSRIGVGKKSTAAMASKSRRCLCSTLAIALGSEWPKPTRSDSTFLISSS